MCRTDVVAERSMRRPGGWHRSGGALVEMAAVLIIFVMMLFGIMEYCRLIYVRQILENAAREGARYAVVNTYNSTLVADTQAQVKKYMGGLDTSLKGYQCSVYMADSNGNNIGSPIDAPFGTWVCVQVQLTYVPITPGLLRMANSMTLSSKCSMGSEAN